MTQGVRPGRWLDQLLIWLMFAVSHLWLAYANLVVRPGTFADVTGVYRYWFELAGTGEVMGIHEPWVYPPLAWLPIALSGLFGSAAYGVVWLVVVGVLDAIAVLLLLRMREGMTLAFLFIALQFLIGPVAVGRLDTVTAALAVIAIVAVWDGRNRLAALLLTVGAWIKVWPGVLWLALLIARGRTAWRGIIGVGAAVSAVVIGVALAFGSGANVLSFVSQQSGRGLQAESVLATPYLWLVPTGAAEVAFDRDILTYQVTGAGSDAVAAASTPLLVAAVVAIALLSLRTLRRGRESRDVFVLAAYALTLALIVTNKVGSPQFFTWLLPVAVLLALRDIRSHTVELLLLGVAAFLTQLVFPWAYGDVLGATPVGLAIITLRNAIEVGLLVVAVVRLSRIPAGDGGRPLPRRVRSGTHHDRAETSAAGVQSLSPSSAERD